MEESMAFIFQSQSFENERLVLETFEDNTKQDLTKRDGKIKKKLY